MVQFRIVLLTASACLSATFAQAQSVGETTVGGGLTLFGPSLQGTYQIEPNVRLRGLAIGGLSYTDMDSDDDGNQYAIDLDVAAAAILVDHYPQGEGWRLSGGFLFNLSDLQATGTGEADEPFEINGQIFDGGSVLGEGEFRRSIAPMVTVGYDHPLSENWILGADVGAIYTGGFDTTFTANSAALQTEVDNSEDFQDFTDEARSYPFLPYVGVTVSFRF